MMEEIAPRLTAYMGKRLDGSGVMITPRDQWNQLNVNSTEYVFIAIEKCPFAKVAQEASECIAVARNESAKKANAILYRYDQNDTKPWNLDRYTIDLDFINRPDLDNIISGATTSDDESVKQLLKDHVFWFKEDNRNDDDHHLSFEELPKEVQSFLDNKGINAIIGQVST